MGRYFFRSSESTGGFYKSRVATADLNSVGKIPELRASLTIRMIIEAVNINTRGRRLNGKGSDKLIGISMTI